MRSLAEWLEHAGGHKEMSSVLAEKIAPSHMSPNAGGWGGGGVGSKPMSTAVHMDPE